MSPAETERAARGSTRVMCRVRPLASSESGSWVGTCGAEVTLAGSPSFSFDGVFPPTASNQAVFEAMRPTLEDVRAGINGAVLAYGQSGAGKSHTMNGGPGDPGVVQRAIADLVSYRDARVLAGATCRLTFSALELYNERLADLMTGASSCVSSAESSMSSLRVVADPRRGMWPHGASEILLGDDVDVKALLETASARRSTGATDLNKDSSRSHLVIILRMETAHFHSKLFLVDLAGCEQVRRSGAAGSRLDEACGINKSLSALGNVVAALTAAQADDDLPASVEVVKAKKKVGGSHVPYRDSKLTFLLSEALGGNARAVLVTCVSPSAADAAETLSTLRFGVRARRIVARPKRNVNASPEKKAASPGASADADATAAELAELRSSVATLHRRLEAARNDQADARSLRAKITRGGTCTRTIVKPIPTFRLWVGLCVAYFAVDAFVLWS